jgi:hypothetical protein
MGDEQLDREKIAKGQPPNGRTIYNYIISTMIYYV